METRVDIQNVWQYTFCRHNFFKYKIARYVLMDMLRRKYEFFDKM